MSLFDKSLDEWVPFVKENSFLIVVFVTSFITVMRMLSVSLILEVCAFIVKATKISY